MGSETPHVRVPGRVLRGAVALLGGGALAVAVFVLIAAGLFLAREPQNAAEAHAMAHSLPGILVAVLLWTGGGSLVGGVLLAVAYVDRRRLSAVVLVAAGSLGALLSLDRGADLGAAVALAPVTLGGYALYEGRLGRGPLAFLAHATALLWVAQLLGLVAVSMRLSGLLFPPLLPVVTLWLWRLADAGALAVLAVAAWYRSRGVAVPRAPVVLAAALLVSFFPDAVWIALSDYVVWGFDPLGWTQMLVATGAAGAILAGPLVRSARRRR